jgi:hypothetical protein
MDRWAGFSPAGRWKGEGRRVRRDTLAELAGPAKTGSTVTAGSTVHDGTFYVSSFISFRWIISSSPRFTRNGTVSFLNFLIHISTVLVLNYQNIYLKKGFKKFCSFLVIFFQFCEVSKSNFIAKIIQTNSYKKTLCEPLLFKLK